MSTKYRKTTEKETHKTIKWIPKLNVSTCSASSRERQLETSRQKRCGIDTTKYESPIRRRGQSITNSIELENSMMFTKLNNDLSNADESFLALERECNMDDKRETLMLANDTLLFDIEPPSLLWDQTVNENSDVEQLDRTEDEYNDGIEISPVKYIGLIRPSTIIEETSSQFDSSSKNGSSSLKSSLYETASINKSVEGLSTSKTEIGNKEDETPDQKQTGDRQKRGTFAFKRANYTFFPDENVDVINESVSFNSSDDVNGETPIKKCVGPGLDSTRAEDDEDQFNNTLERVEFFLETGKKIFEETPVAKRSIQHLSFLETPLFSCKRKRLLNEMASIELLPTSKRGPLIDFVPRKL